MKEREPLLASDCDGKRLFVHLRDSGIHPLVVAFDGLALTFFGKRDGPYLEVSAVIAWHEKELADSRGRSGSRAAADAFRRALEKFSRGEVTWHADKPREG